MNLKKICNILSFLLIISGSCAVLAQNPVTVYPKEFPKALRNPLKGFRQDLDKANDSKYKYTTIVRDYIRWNEIENNATDGVQKLIDFANDNWSHLPALNVMVIPRVYLDWSSDAGNEYWPADLTDGDWTSQVFKDRVVNMVRKMGEAWDNDPRVAWVQTGIIGYWGEQENPVGIDEDGWAERLGSAYEDAFKNKKLLVRNQDNWDPFGYKWGVYWDSYGHPGQTNGSWADIRYTTSQGRYLSEVVEGEVAYGWGENTFDPLYGGEPEITLNNSQYTNNMINVIKELHCTGLGWIASYMEINSGLSVNLDTIAANADRIQKAFGYRFIIPEFTCFSSVGQGETLDIQFQVKNTGSAPFYRNWPVAFTLIEETTRQIFWTEEIPNVDITTWRPGSNYNYSSGIYTNPAPVYEVSASFKIPENIPTGQYMAGIAILDPSTRKPGIFFEIENFLTESQSQPLCRIGIGQDLIGSSEIQPSIFGDPLEDDSRYYSMSGATNVHISYPANGAGFGPPASFPVSVSAFKNDGSIDSVELYINSSRKNSLQSAPYIFNVSNLPIGIYTIKVKAYDNEGAIHSDEISVNIQIPGGLPWHEKFDLPNGTKSNFGAVSWNATRGGGIFEVRNGAFEISDGKTYIGELTTGIIDISVAPVSVSLDVTANTGGLDKGEDYVKLYKVIDGGPEILIGMVDGAESNTFEESNITGKTLKLVIRGYTTFSGEVYRLDNLSITYDVPVPTKDLTIQVTGNGIVTPSAGIHSYYKGQSVVLTATPLFGYVFDSWSGDLSGILNPDQVIMDTNKVITANFAELPKYTLTTGAANGSITLSKPGGPYYQGTQLYLTAIPDSGYKFAGWSGDIISSTNPVSITIDANKDITANFIAIPRYTVTVSAENGSVSLSPNLDSYPEGTNVTLTATPDSGYLFNSWSGDLTGAVNSATILVEKNLNIVANFAVIPKYTLTVSAVNGAVLLSPNLDAYPEGSKVTLSATPDSGFVFYRWIGDYTGTLNPASITIGKDLSITASFTAIPNYTLTVSAANGSVSMSPSGGSYPEDTEVTLTAIPNTGYEFTSWNGDFSGTSNPQIITMTRDKSITADFDLIIGLDNFNMPVKSNLGQNHPNPFTKFTTIPYQLSEASHVKISIYNILGELVITLVDEYQEPGYYKVDCNVDDFYGSRTSSGIFIYRLETGYQIEMKKFTVGQ